VDRAELIMQQSLEWTYLQTPQFTFSSRSNNNKDATVATTRNFPLIEFTARFGVVTECNIQLTPSSPSIGENLLGKRLHEIADWETLLPQPQTAEDGQRWRETVEYLQRVLPRVEMGGN
jgi:lipoate-protein ligase A